MNCLTNLRKCKAWCCKYFFVSFVVRDDMEKYYQLRGYKEAKAGEKLTIKIYARCEYLKSNDKCMYHGTSKQLDFCKKWKCKELEQEK